MIKIEEDKVEAISIEFNELNIISIIHSYELSENAVFIQKPISELNVAKKTQTIGWIFRRTLDYVLLNYVNGDWNRKFL